VEKIMVFELALNNCQPFEDKKNICRELFPNKIQARYFFIVMVYPRVNFIPFLEMWGKW
jgi:hypothetical protein